MKKTMLLVGLLSVLAGCAGEDNAAAGKVVGNKVVAVIQPGVVPDKAMLLEDAKNAVKTLGGTLKGELQAAMRSGGPVQALSACNTKAPEIAKMIAEEQHVQVARVSLRNRNPASAPNEWQAAVLKDFEQRKAKGEPVESLVYSEEVKQAGTHEFRFMKAIPTEPLCLTCHGTEISPAITTKLTELYPQDKATGFKEGDLRGAFVVVRNLSQ